MNDLIIAAGIYLAALVILLVFAFRLPVAGDQVQEFEILALSLRENRVLRDTGLLSACLLSVSLPYAIVKLLRIPMEVAFRLAPCLSSALCPAMSYLIARLYLAPPPAIVCALIATSSFYFCFYPNNGRMAHGIGFTSLLYYAILTGNLPLSLIAVLLVLFSHYATILYNLIIIAPALAVMILTGMSGAYPLLIIFTLALAAAVFWFEFFQRQARDIIHQVVSNSVNYFMSRLKLQRLVVAPDYLYTPALSVDRLISARRFPQRFEMASGLMLAGLMVLGAASLPGSIPSLYLLLALSSLGVIALSLANPVISNMSGVVRAYATSLPVLAPLAVFGMRTLAGLAGWNQGAAFTLLIFLILGQIIAVSGILHLAHGWDKRSLREINRLSQELN